MSVVIGLKFLHYLALFLAGGLITSNFFLIKGGIFILIIHALIDAHYLISRYEMFKELEKEEKKSNEKK